MNSFGIIVNRFLVFLCISVVVIRCGPSSVKENTQKVFRMNMSKGITSLDPAYSRNIDNVWGCNQLYKGLVQLDERLQVKPCIASRWEIKEGGKLYRFYLRDDVFFHDHEVFDGGIGRKVVASDFVYSLSRILDDKVASPGKWIFNSLAMSSPFSAVNDSVLEIRLKHAFPPFIGILSMAYCTAIPYEAIDKYGEEFRVHPIGTGPFQFKMWEEDSKLVLVKNPKYFEKDLKGNSYPYLDAVTISFIKDVEIEFMEFLAGKIDFVNSKDGKVKESTFTKKGDLKESYKDKMKLLTASYLNTEYLGFYMDGSKENPLLKKEIRQAINYGFDRAKMAKFLRNGLVNGETVGFVPEGLPSFNRLEVKHYAYDPEKARSLVLAAGYNENNPAPEIVLHTTPDYVDICRFLQHALKEINLSLRIEVVQSGTFREMVANGKVGFFRKSWIADYPDGENYLSLFYSKNFAPEGPNYTHFKNSVYDELYELSQQETNDSIRYVLYNQMENILFEHAPVVVLFYDKVVRMTQSNIEGLGINAANNLDLRKVKIK